MIEQTLVLLKPDAVQRCLVGEILSRFEKAGIKIVGMKMAWIDEDFAKKHYTDDISKRRGEKVRNNLLKYIVEGPIVALALQGINVIEVVRKIVGGTEPSTAPPGTIRGDYAHHTFGYADKKDIAIKNLIHASGNKDDAKYELNLWFSEEELHDYTTVHDLHVL